MYYTSQLLLLTTFILNNAYVYTRKYTEDGAYPCHDQRFCRCITDSFDSRRRVTCNNIDNLAADTLNNIDSNVTDLLQIIGGSEETALSATRFNESAKLGYNEVIIENACINYIEPYFFLKRLQTSSNLIWRISLTFSVCLTTLENYSFSDLTRLQVLDLSANSLHQIHDFAFKNLRRVDTLYLQQNRLTHLNNHTFADLSSLVTLDLSHNDLFSITSGAFTKLARLKTLLLNNNRLFKLNDGLFASLAISTLNISNNMLTKFSPNLVTGTTRESLRTLSLDYNKLENLSYYVMDLENANPGNAELSLRGNSWYCSCQILWMKNSEKFIVQSSVRCAEPKKLSGKVLEAIDSFDLCPSDEDIRRNSSSTPADKSKTVEEDEEYISLICGVLVVIVAIIILFGFYRNRDKICDRRNTLLGGKKGLYRQADNNEEIPFNETPIDNDGDGLVDNSNNHRSNTDFLSIQNAGV